MKRFLQLLILACLSFAVVGCYQDSTGPEVPVVGNLTLSQEQMNVSAEGGEFSVDIYTEYMFQASTNVDWIEILYGSCTPEYCTQYFNVKANDTTSPREGIITIFCDDYNLSATLTVKQESQNYPFSLTISLDTSRTSLGEKDGGKYLYWLSEDTILCNGLVSSRTSILADNHQFATFMFADTPTPPYNIVYPAPSNGEVATKEGCYPVVFPEQQNYVEGTFDSGAAPMYGYTTDTNTMLTHLVGVLRFEIVVGDVTLSQVVISSKSNYLSGVFDLNCQTGELTPQEGKVSNQIVYNFGDGLQVSSDNSKPFYITMPAGSYESETVYISIYSNGETCITEKVFPRDLTISSGQITKISVKL